MSRRQNERSKTVKYRVLFGKGDSVRDLRLLEQFHTTVALYRSCVSFYVSVLKENLDIRELPGLQQKQRRLEQLTHQTRANPNPPYDLDTIGKNIPAYFRRSAINAAVGIAGSWGSNYDRAKNGTQHKKNAKTRSNRPPTLRLQNSQWPVYFKDLYKDFQGDSKDDDRTVIVKLYTGHAWVWRKVRISTTQPVPPGAGTKSLKVIIKDNRIYLHRTISKARAKSNYDPRSPILSVDLNLSRTVVMTVLGYDGRVHKVKFVRTDKDNHRRKKYLDSITRKLGETKVIPEGRIFCKGLWNKVRHLNDDLGHQLSRKIVDFALANGCGVIVFEHLEGLRPEKGSRSRRMNSRLMYWLIGSIYKKTLYKAQWEGLRVTRVNPKYTSQMCTRHHPILVYTKPEGTARPTQSTFVCTVCGYRVDADFNGSVNVGRRYFGRENVRALLFKALGGDIQAWDAATDFISRCMDPLGPRPPRAPGPGKCRAEAAGSTIQSAWTGPRTIAAPAPNPGQVEVP